MRWTRPFVAWDKNRCGKRWRPVTATGLHTIELDYGDTVSRA